MMVAVQGGVGDGRGGRVGVLARRSQNFRPVNVADAREERLVHEQEPNRRLGLLHPGAQGLGVGVGPERVGAEHRAPRGLDLGAAVEDGHRAHVDHEPLVRTPQAQPRGGGRRREGGERRPGGEAGRGRAAGHAKVDAHPLAFIPSRPSPAVKQLFAVCFDGRQDEAVHGRRAGREPAVGARRLEPLSDEQLAVAGRGAVHLVAFHHPDLGLGGWAEGGGKRPSA